MAIAFSQQALAIDPAPGAACSVNQARIFSGGPELSGFGHWLVCSGGTWQASFTSDASGLMAVGTTAVGSGARMELAGGALRLSQSSSSAGGEIQFAELLAQGTNTVALRARGTLASSLTWLLPDALGSSGQVMTVGSGGTLYWSTAGGASNLDGLSDGIVNNTVFSMYLGTEAGQVAGGDDDGNTAVGYQAMRNLGTGGSADFNTAFGAGALMSLTTGGNNTTMGRLAGASMTTASENTAIGQHALYNESTEWSNTVVGNAAMYNANGASGNIAIGANSGHQITTGDGNTIVGSWGGDNLTSGSRNILIGFNIDFPSATDSGQLNIGNLIYGRGVDGTAGTLSTGSIGIGTPTPNAKLEIFESLNAPIGMRITNWNGGSLAESSILFRNDGGELGGIGTSSNAYTNSIFRDKLWLYTDSSPGIMIMADGTNGRIEFYTGAQSAANERMRITNAGSVGIGTTSPDARLDVFGPIKGRGLTSTQSGQLMLNEMSGAGTNTVALRAPGTLSTSLTWTLPEAAGSPGQALTVGSGGTMYWATPSATPSFPLLSPTYGSVGTPVYSFSADSDTGVYSKGAGTLGFAINGTHIVSITNNGIGVGSSDFNPNGGLEVRYDAGVTSGFNGGNAPHVNLSRGAGNFAGLHLGYWADGTNDIAGAMVVSSSASDMIFGTRPSGTPVERIRLTSAGSLGIGTSSPDARLDVFGELKVRGVSSSVPGRLLLNEASSSGTNTVMLRAPSNLANSLNFELPSVAGTVGHVLTLTGAGTLGFAAAGSGSWLTQSGNVYYSSGSVGIGTSSPKSSLHVYSPQNTTLPLLVGVAGTGNNEQASLQLLTRGGALNSMGNTGVMGWEIAANGDSYSSDPSMLGIYYWDGVAWYSNLYLEPTGAYLKYNANGNFGGFYVQNNATGNATTDGIMLQSDNSGNAYIYQNENGPLMFGTNQNERVRISATGMVGIGTSSIASGARLDVVGGAIRASQQSSTVAGEVQFAETLSNGTNTIAFRAPGALASSLTFQLPSVAGTVGHVLTLTGTGTLGFAAVGGGVTYPLLSTTRGSAATPVYSFSADSDTGLFSTGAGTLALATQGTTRITINQEGRVSIGTENPTSILTIRDTDTRTAASYFAMTDFTLNVDPSAASSAFAYYANFNRLTSSSSNLGSADLYGLNNSIHLYGGSGAVANGYSTMNDFTNFAGRTVNNAYASINTVTSNHASSTISNARAVGAQVVNSSGTITNAIGVFVGSVQGTNRWSLYAEDSGAPSYFAGNVGIGTATPGTLLDIVGATQAKVTNTSSGAYQPVFTGLAPNTTGGNRVQIEFGRNASFNNMVSFDFVYDANGSNNNRLDFNFYSAAVPAMSITGGSKVGIGTTVVRAGNQLEVTGGAIAAGNGGELRMMENLSQGTNFVALRARGTLGSDLTWLLPDALGSAGQVMTVGSAGTLYWSTPSGGGAGSIDSLVDGMYNATSSSLALGTLAGQFLGNDDGDNLAVGDDALRTAGNGVTASYNTAIGANAFYSLTDGDANTGVGRNAGVSLTTGSYNTVVGETAMDDEQTGWYNTAIGDNALDAQNGANGNTALGAYAGSAVSTGSYNTLIGGSTASNLTTGSNNIVLGRGIQLPSSGSSRTMILGNMIYGWGVTSGGTVSTGSIGIGTMTPTAKFDVVGPNAPGGADYVVSRFAADVGTGDGLFVAIENTDATNRQAGLDFMSQGARRWGIGSDRFSDGGHSFFIRDWVNAFDAFFIDSNDKVGIATTTPLARLDVHGQIRSTSFTTTSGTIDFSQGNAGTTNFDCGAGTMAFRDLNDGGSYSVAVTSTGTAACNFSTTIQGSGTGTVSYRFSPTNGARTASSHTIYSIIRIGATVYISWITGF